ncbi:fibronectin type III domain-containing protein [Candidatus Eisenbacteria bacterium]|uniref:Fibronectin type III domain-containing protein n=1 Tax=Eiseniibacteriota bacterium TaxID=2212470 RepID=A0ABV6YKZ5_UNCEI
MSNRVFFVFLIPIAFTIALALPPPAAQAAIDQIQVSNHSSSSATISWTTTDFADGCVHYGLTPALGDTVCDSRPDDDLHVAGLISLEPDTTYYFEVASGGEINNNGGALYTFETTTVGIGIPYTIYGDLTLPPEWTLFTVTIKSAGGDMSHPLSTLIDSVAVWSLNLGNLKNPLTDDVFHYATGDSLFLRAGSGPTGGFQDSTTVSGMSPQYVGQIVMDVLPTNALPVDELLLLGGFPNPFQRTTTLEYRSPVKDRVVIEVFDPTGRKCATLLDQVLPAGNGRVTWEGTGLPGGIYLARIQAGSLRAATSLVLLK